MAQASEPTAWARGRFDDRRGPAQLLFGQMYEDSLLELTLFEPGRRVFCIASAGCTALALAARGDDVTAVDLNPAQVAYVDARAKGGPVREGRAEQGFRRLRRLGALVGWSRPTLERFCALDDPDDQLRFWRDRLDTRRLRAALAAFLRPLFLRRVFAQPFVEVLPSQFDRILHARLERGFARHANRDNPYAAQLLLGRRPAAQASTLTVAQGDAAEFLQRCAPGSFHAFSLSNVLDGASPRYGERLLAAVHHAAAPVAVGIFRSFGEPQNEDDARRAADERSLIWGSVRVMTA
jgi:S-adenosylmethionine:diacylglycerol 3-amino-3-carboxypropyl transferase